MNVDLNPFNEGLELFEKEGVLLPVARVVKPVEYVVERQKLNEQPETYGQEIREWEELERLIYLSATPCTETDEELWHPFDVEFKLKNRFLFRPNRGEFKPWHSFYAGGAGVEHYYHYWQVHQVYAIQKNYAIFTNYNRIFQLLEDKAKDRAIFLKPLDSEPRLTFNGKTQCFDALSFYIVMYNNERSRTFAPIPEIEGVKRLDDEQFERYRILQVNHAKFVCQKYHLTIAQLYEFLIELLDLQAEYQRNERGKLADEIGKDLLFLRTMIASITNQSFDDISEELSRRGVWSSQFRRLDEGMEIQDCVKEYFTRLGKDYNAMFSSFQFSDSEVDNL